MISCSSSCTILQKEGGECTLEILALRRSDIVENFLLRIRFEFDSSRRCDVQGRGGRKIARYLEKPASSSIYSFVYLRIFPAERKCNVSRIDRDPFELEYRVENKDETLLTSFSFLLTNIISLVRGKRI